MKTKFTKNKNKNKTRKKTTPNYSCLLGSMEFWEKKTLKKEYWKIQSQLAKQLQFAKQRKSAARLGLMECRQRSDSAGKLNTGQTETGCSRSSEGQHLPCPSSNTRDPLPTAARRARPGDVPGKALRDPQGRVACSEESQMHSCASNTSLLQSSRDEDESPEGAKGIRKMEAFISCRSGAGEQHRASSRETASG